MCHAEAKGLFNNICAGPESLVTFNNYKLREKLHDFFIDTANGTPKMEVFIVQVDFSCQCVHFLVVSLSVQL
jgi:hypothetical protein